MHIHYDVESALFQERNIRTQCPSHPHPFKLLLPLVMKVDRISQLWPRKSSLNTSCYRNGGRAKSQLKQLEIGKHLFYTFALPFPLLRYSLHAFKSMDFLLSALRSYLWFFWRVEASWFPLSTLALLLFPLLCSRLGSRVSGILWVLHLISLGDIISANIQCSGSSTF